MLAGRVSSNDFPVSLGPFTSVSRQAPRLVPSGSPALERRPRSCLCLPPGRWTRAVLGYLTGLHAASWPHFFFFKNIYLAVPSLSYGMWDLVPWPGVEPGPLSLRVQGRGPASTRESQNFCLCLSSFTILVLSYTLNLSVIGKLGFIFKWLFYEEGVRGSG